MHIRIGDGSGNEDYRTCSACGCDYEPEIIDRGEDVSMSMAFSRSDHGRHGDTARSRE